MRDAASPSPSETPEDVARAFVEAINRGTTGNVDAGALQRALDDEMERNHPRAKLAAALRELDVEVGRAFLSTRLVRWIFRKAGLTPKGKYRVVS